MTKGLPEIPVFAVGQNQARAAEFVRLDGETYRTYTSRISDAERAK
jgi:hypothetical protein